MEQRFQFGIVKSCSEPHVPEPGKYYRPWKEKCPIEKCSKCQMVQNLLEKIEHLIHGWTLVYHHCLLQNLERMKNFSRKHIQQAIRPQAKDIVRTWLYYTLLDVNMLTEKNHGLKHGLWDMVLMKKE